MGNVFDIVIVAPFTSAGAVTPGMTELGFTGAPAYGDRPSDQVWTRLDQKLPIVDGQKVGIDGLCRAVAALPWPRTSPPSRLRVLWMDDHTLEDDGWTGRTGPYAWNVETWDVTTGAEVSDDGR